MALGDGTVTIGGACSCSSAVPSASTGGMGFGSPAMGGSGVPGSGGNGTTGGGVSPEAVTRLPSRTLQLISTVNRHRTPPAAIQANWVFRDTILAPLLSDCETFTDLRDRLPNAAEPQ